ICLQPPSWPANTSELLSQKLEFAVICPVMTLLPVKREYVGDAVRSSTAVKHTATVPKPANRRLNRPDQRLVLRFLRIKRTSAAGSRIHRQSRIGNKNLLLSISCCSQ